jgi:hypothetical protein
MNIFALIVTLSLNCFATKAKQMKTPLARAVTMALNEYYPLSPLFLKAVKGHLPRLEGPPLVAHALPQAVTAVKCSSLNNKLKRAQINGISNDRLLKIDARRLFTLVSRTDWDKVH